MCFQSWSGLAGVLVIGFCTYAGLVVMLRVSGKRTWSKMNAFGSTIGTLLLSKDVALAEGLVEKSGFIAFQ
jgi:uncharacterized membrane protein YcaP (DUF421 family)